jgi:hypothetical protein
VCGHRSVEVGADRLLEERDVDGACVVGEHGEMLCAVRRAPCAARRRLPGCWLLAAG